MVLCANRMCWMGALHGAEVNSSAVIVLACMQVVDSAVLRFPKAVTHFSPGSYTSRPLQTTSFANVFMAGDWVKDVPHGANGLSQVGDD